ncbi:hypothetical protein [Promicromonospora xylanilytica]
MSDDQQVRVDVPRTKGQEFTAFVHDAGPYLYKTALLLSGDPHRAEELVQATFERSYRSWQAAGACATAAAVAFSLALAGPVPVPGMGELTVPGGAQLRELVGLDQTQHDNPADPGRSASLMPSGGAPRVTVPENAKLPTYD